MKKIFVFLAVMALLLAIILFGLLIYNLEIISSIAGLAFGLLIFYLSKKSSQIKKIIRFTFLVTVITLLITIYKSIFSKTEIANTKTLQITKMDFDENSKEKLRSLKIDNIDLY